MWGPADRWGPSRHTKRSPLQCFLSGPTRIHTSYHISSFLQALEHLRSLIEQQNHQLDAARTNFRKAKQEMEHWQKQMEEAQQRKDLLAGELNTLVQQSAGAQLKVLLGHCIVRCPAMEHNAIALP